VKAAVLAGGGGTRLGGVSKAVLELGGRPLAVHVCDVLAQVCDSVAIVCKPDTELPPIAGVERWDEPAEPRHPLTGIVHALEQADGPVLVCAVDMPWITADACRSLLDAAPGAVAAVAVGDGEMCPVFAVYAPDALETLKKAPAGAPLRETVDALEPARVALPPPLLRSVNEPSDLAT
jgi:molybdopterin-guanine dinucleotide biosynthesis protein A